MARAGRGTVQVLARAASAISAEPSPVRAETPELIAAARGGRRRGNQSRVLGLTRHKRGCSDRAASLGLWRKAMNALMTGKECLATLLLTAACALGLSHAAYAEHLIPVQVPLLREACVEDYRRLCWGVPPGGGRIVLCLNAHA